MPKRKQVDREQTDQNTPAKRLRSVSKKPSDTNGQQVDSKSHVDHSSPSKQKPTFNGSHEDSGSPTPKADGKILFSTPKRAAEAQTPSKSKRADQSARRKSARRLAEAQDEDDWDGENTLAQAILDEEADEAAEDEPLIKTPTATPSKRPPGRPKGSKARRSPTPEGEIAPEEKYFYQNRPGRAQISENAFSSVKLLTHDEYSSEILDQEDHHIPEKAYLMKLYARSFPQWKFELAEGFNICLYGYGSKRILTKQFAQWLATRSKPRPTIVVVNGYTPKLNIKNIICTIRSAIAAEDEAPKLTGQPQEMLDALISFISSHPPSPPVTIIINSIDSVSLRKSGLQSILARLAAHHLVNLVVTTDTPTFPLLWNSSLLDQFNFALHDCTTFASYDAEIMVVDEVYNLLGRKGRRVGGKEGIKYVLKSLPPNAQNLYRILLGEILSILCDDTDDHAGEDADAEDGYLQRSGGRETSEQVGVEYRLLYQKASEEFVASSDMNFRFLLKEFHDHQMITSRRDASGTELLCVPLGKEEMQAVLDELVVT